MTILVIGLLQTAIFIAGLLAGYSLQSYKKTQINDEVDAPNRHWSRSDLPYDAMGDYSGLEETIKEDTTLTVDLVRNDDEIFPKVVPSTGHQSPDEWYRDQFGGCND